MLTVEELMEITVLKKQGQSIHGIAKSLGVSRNTVRRYVHEGEAAGVRKAGVNGTFKLTQVSADRHFETDPPDLAV